MASAVIVEAVRSPIARGKANGALSSLHPVELLAQVLSALVARQDLDPGLIEDVIVGCVSQAGEQSGNVGRQALLSAGFPIHVPSVTVERKCGSSQQALDFAIQGVIAGAYDIAIAAGVESMSRVPMGIARLDADTVGPGVRERFPLLVPQGVSAELIAQQWNLSRAQLDDYSARSHQRASRATSGGEFDDEIIPIRLPDGSVLGHDETIREGTTAEGLAGLKLAFDAAQYRELFPDVEWKITAGSSSQLADGASAILVMSEERCASLGLRPLARIVASAVTGDDPLLMLTGPIPATAKVLERAKMSLDEMAAVEVNEAFASVPLAWLAEYPVDASVLNPVGGAIALGHPLGASGCRIATTLVHHLQRIDARHGLQTMCEAGGMANATIFESLSS